jgi:hypothetical protein
MTAGQYFALLAAVYFAPQMTPTMRTVFGVVCTLLAAIVTFAGRS